MQHFGLEQLYSYIGMGGTHYLCTVHAEKILYQLVLHELATNLDLLDVVNSTWTT